MDRIEYQITFMTFFIGLGVADLFTSIVRLLKRRASVQWHWLPIIWITIAFMGLNIAWFAYHTMFTQPFTASGPGFLLAVSPAIFIFAFTVSILPHDIPESGINLKEYYFSNHKLIFSLALLDSTSRSITQYFILSGSNTSMTFVDWLPYIILQLLLIGMIITKNPIYHTIVSGLIFIFYFMILLSSQL
jgi:hypothetical protein